ncbi:MAG: hypothetical protein DID92_2727743727 [Candidatus Nitrotoga sp. SPKER]|nr:MAG: hypothetical protein DID92_2727743727 [Candidatus Nitrotoga sp. SPKER]
MTSVDKASEDIILGNSPNVASRYPINIYLPWREYVANCAAGRFGNNIVRSLESWMHEKAATSAVNIYSMTSLGSAFPLPAKSFNLYSFLIAVRPNRQRCESFLEKLCKQRSLSL